MAIGLIVPWLGWCLVGILAALGVGSATQSALVALAVFVVVLAVSVGVVLGVHMHEEAKRWRRWGP